MSRDISTLDWRDCIKCHAGLERWNTGEGKLLFCPSCGKKLLKKQSDRLWYECSDDEIADIIEGRVLAMLPYANGANESDFASYVWQFEKSGGALSYSGFKSDEFVSRHEKWVDRALLMLNELYGENEYRLNALLENTDVFLVEAFIQATHHYLIHQLGIDRGKRITEKRAKEIRRMVKACRYDGGF